MSKGKHLDRYGLRVRPKKDIPNEIAWIAQAFIIFMAKLIELRKVSKEYYKKEIIKNNKCDTFVANSDI